MEKLWSFYGSAWRKYKRQPGAQARTTADLVYHREKTDLHKMCKEQYADDATVRVFCEKWLTIKASNAYSSRDNMNLAIFNAYEKSIHHADHNPTLTHIDHVLCTPTIATHR